MNRVVITGIGVVAPGAVGTADFWDLLTVGRTATRRVTLFDACGYRSRVAAESLARGRPRRRGGAQEISVTAGDFPAGAPLKPGWAEKTQARSGVLSSSSPCMSSRAIPLVSRTRVQTKTKDSSAHIA